MARYIDADAIHKFVDEKVAEGKDGWKNGVPYEWAYALTIIDNAPTADVAPRAEVEQLQDVNADLNESLRLAAEANKDLRAKVDRWRFGLEAVLEERAEDRAEVAREIFEEIRKRACSERGFFVVNSDIDDFIAELKKKYTGG